MRYLAELGIGLSVVFGVFVLALLAELCYILCWKKTGGGAPPAHDCLRSAAEVDKGAGSVKRNHHCKKPIWGGSQVDQRSSQDDHEYFAREASLVGSFGGYDGTPACAAVCTNMPAGRTAAVSTDHTFDDYLRSFWDYPDAHSLFSIKEETKEDMELAAAAAASSATSTKPNSRLRSRTPSDVLTAHFTSGSSSPLASAGGTPFTSSPDPSTSPPALRYPPGAPGKWSPYAACTVWPISSFSARPPASSTAAAEGGAEVPRRINLAGAQPLSPAVGAVGRTSLRLLFERSPLSGPAAAHTITPSPSSQLLASVADSTIAQCETSNAAALPPSPLPFYRRLSLSALFERLPGLSVSNSCPRPSGHEEKQHPPH